MPINEVKRICIQNLTSSGLNNNTDYVSRLNREFEDLEKYEKHKGGKAQRIIEQIGKEGYPVSRNKSNSLILFLTGLSSIDPVKEKKKCVTEVLVSGSCPDIDTDFDPRIREWVKEHIVKIFGEDHVCSIGTYQTYRTKAVILDVVRALNKDVNEANEITKKIDSLSSFDDDEGEEKKVDNLDFDDLCKHYPELRAYLKNNPEVRHHAEILRDQIKNMGTHAGGVIISDINLKGRIPVLYDKPSSEDRKIISAWAEAGGNEELSSVGLVKFDILSVNNLPVISDCVNLIKANRGITVKRSDIPIDDSYTIRMASKKDLVGIFQLDNPSTKIIADKVELDGLDDVAVLTSLIRPGPRDMGMDMEYAERKHGKAYALPKVVRELLSETYGIIVFQEDIMRIAQKIGGLTATESYKFLKVFAKKQGDQFPIWRDKFIKGSQKLIEKGLLLRPDVENLVEQLAAFANYGFNKSHAVGYSALSTAQLWLKNNYPLEYITSLISNSKLGKKKYGKEVFVEYVNYARHNGIEVLPPDINLSLTQFAIWDNKILFSLEHIKNVASMAELINKFQPFKSIEDFHNRVKIDVVTKTGKVNQRRPNKRVIESLIASGAFDRFGKGDTIEEKRNYVMREYYRVRGDKNPSIPQYNKEKWIELEKDMTGLCLSQPPLFSEYSDIIKQNGYKLICEIGNRKRVQVFGRVEKVVSRTSGTGNPMYVVDITDGLDNLTFFVFKGAQQYFRDNFKVGTIAAIPLNRFDSGMRFFDDNKDCDIIKK